MENKSTGKTVVIIILTILLIGALGYIIYDKVIVQKHEEPTPTETKIEDNVVEDTTVEANTTEYYQAHSESLTKDVWQTYNQNWEEIETKCDGTIGGELYEIILNNDNTYEYYHHLICGGGQKQIGTYTIENDKLTLVCNPDKSEQCIDNNKKVFQKNKNNTLTNNEGLILNKVTKDEMFYFGSKE